MDETLTTQQLPAGWKAALPSEWPAPDQLASGWSIYNPDDGLDDCLHNVSEMPGRAEWPAVRLLLETDDRATIAALYRSGECVEAFVREEVAIA